MAGVTMATKCDSRTRRCTSDDIKYPRAPWCSRADWAARSDNEFVIDVLDVRAHASELALRAAQSALLHQGARGYLMSSDVQRRVRESHFVAIVTPAIKHLRKEIARLSALEQPA